MIALMIALAVNPAPAAQAVQATLQSCVVENGRYVCRYAVPDILIVPIPGNDIVANAPDVILGDAPSVETPPANTIAIEAAASPPPVVTLADPGPLRPIDASVLTAREAELVSRCADAGWMSLCLPDDRRAARQLRDKETAYLAVLREVTRLLADDRCEVAVTTALDSGHLALAREARDYCAVPASAAKQPAED